MKVPYIFVIAKSIWLYAPVAQLDRALACGARGRKFESCRVYHISRICEFFYFGKNKGCAIMKIACLAGWMIRIDGECI